MKHLFIPYELAVIAKEKGFNGPCCALYNPNLLNDSIWTTTNSNIDLLTNNKKIVCAAPLYQQIVDWFREKHSISILVEIGEHEFSYKLFNNKKDKMLPVASFNGTYYEALNKAIEVAFKLI